MDKIFIVPEERLEEIIHIVKLGIESYNDAHYFKSNNPEETIAVLEEWCNAVSEQEEEQTKHGAPRGTEENPCWCNGPWEREEQHHDFCRRRRLAWKLFMESLRIV